MVHAFLTGGQRLNGNVVVAAQQVAGAVHHYCHRQLASQNGICPDGVLLVIEFQVITNIVAISMKPLVALNMIVG